MVQLPHGPDCCRWPSVHVVEVGAAISESMKNSVDTLKANVNWTSCSSTKNDGRSSTIRLLSNPLYPAIMLMELPWPFSEFCKSRLNFSKFLHSCNQ